MKDAKWAPSETDVLRALEGVLTRVVYTRLWYRLLLGSKESSRLSRVINVTSFWIRRDFRNGVGY
jgi:NADH/NAD ratio-sensing transcriptional regulator Rex